jgi:hypothetical protein
LWQLFTCMCENSAWNSNFIWLCALSSQSEGNHAKKTPWWMLIKIVENLIHSQNQIDAHVLCTCRPRLMHKFLKCCDFWSTAAIQEGINIKWLSSVIPYPAQKHSYYTRKTDKFWHLPYILLVPCCPSGFSWHQTCPEGCQKRLPVQILAWSKTKTYISTQNRSLQILSIFVICIGIHSTYLRHIPSVWTALTQCNTNKKVQFSPLRNFRGLNSLPIMTIRFTRLSSGCQGWLGRIS